MSAAATAVLLASVLCLGWPSAAVAQPCPIDSVGGSYNAFSAQAFARSVPSAGTDPDELYDFIGPGGCTTVMFGPNPPVNCLQVRSPSTVVLAAFFSQSADNTTVNGCTFNCDGGTCQVRGGTGLPVELMEFSVEADDSGDSAEGAESGDEPDAD